jgi:ATP-binding cassette subfamily B protein RaxB
MSFLDQIFFGFGRQLPVVLQTEVTECGLACLAMVSRYHGHHIDLPSLRRRFPVSLRGTTLVGLIQIAGKLGFGTRPVKLGLESLRKLRVPCILHWDFSHFVVLKAFGNGKVIIHDPAVGERQVSWADISRSFTGVALELWPGPEFKAHEKTRSVRLRSLLGQVECLSGTLMQVFALALTLEVFTLVSPFFLQLVIDNVIPSADRNLLSTLALGFCLFMLIQQGVTAIRTWVLLYLGTTLSLQWRANVFSHLIRLPVQYFEKRHIADVVSRFDATEQIQRSLTVSFVEAVLDGLMTFVTLAVMLLYSSKLAAIPIAAMSLYAMARCVWYVPLRNATELEIIQTARQHSHFLETVRGVKVLKLFQREDERRIAWLELAVDQVNANLRTQRLQLLYKTLNGLLFGIENILIIWLGASFVLDGDFTVGVLMAFIAYKSQFDSRVTSLIDKLFELKMLRLQGERLADIVLTEAEVTSTCALVAPFELSPSITVRGLGYRYAPQEPHVLNDVNFQIAAGESVAIVGPSGCGKSTLMNVLLGVLPATEGEILLGGIPLQKLGFDSMRRMVGTVLQDDVLFAGSIADNICFFDPHPEQEWISECARLAAVADDVEAMPMGYNTLVGDMGTVLSGGQKQRILLARALYKRPKILFLDEATSHLDLAREHQVNCAVKALNMTRVIIAHRPETIGSANRVIVLMGGTIVQDSHLPAREEAMPTHEKIA